MKKQSLIVLCLLVCAQLILGAMLVPAGLAASEEQPWPGNGEIYRMSGLYGGDVSLSIHIDQIGEGYATYVKVYRDTGELLSGLFIAGSGTVAMELTAGTYTIKTGVGKTWYGVEEAFGKSGSYETLLFNGDTSKVKLEPDYSYEITINTSRSVPEDSQVNSKDISWGSF